MKPIIVIVIVIVILTIALFFLRKKPLQEKFKVSQRQELVQRTYNDQGAVYDPHAIPSYFIPKGYNPENNYPQFNWKTINDDGYGTLNEGSGYGRADEAIRMKLHEGCC